MNKYLEVFSKENMEADKALEDLLKLQKGDSKPITTGYKFLDDNLIGGLNNKMVFALSRPSMGKTYMSANIQRHLLENFEDVRILRINLEMPTQSLLLRELKNALNKPMKAIISQEFTEEEKLKVEETVRKFKDPRITDFSQPVKGEDLRNLLRAFYQTYQGQDVKKVVMLDHLHVYSSKDDIDNVLEIFNDVKMADPNISFIVFAQLNRTLEDEWRASKERKSFNFNMFPSSKFIYLTDKLMQYGDIIFSMTIPQVVDLEIFGAVNKDRNKHLEDSFIEESKESNYAKLKGLNRIYYNFIKIRMNDDFDDPRIFCEVLDPAKEVETESKYKELSNSTKIPDIPVFNVPSIDMSIFEKEDVIAKNAPTELTKEIF